MVKIMKFLQWQSHYWHINDFVGDRHWTINGKKIHEFVVDRDQEDQWTRDWNLYKHFPVYALFITLAGLGLLRKSKRKKNADKYLRGAKIVTPRELNSLTKKEPTRHKIGNINVPVSAEPQGFLIPGGTGSGKSTIIGQMMETDREDKSIRAVIFDINGELAKKHARPGDILLNPLDRRSAKYGIFGDIQNPQVDAARLASTIVPRDNGTDKFWGEGPYVCVRDLAIGLCERGRKTNRDLYHALNSMPLPEKIDLVRGKAAEGILTGPEKTVGSILTMLATYSDALSNLDPDGDEQSFSIRQWYESHRGWQTP
jgi:Predicted ATPase